MLNDYDIQVAVSTFTRNTQPKLLGLALMVEHLAEWADDNSDGWMTWRKPSNAAAKAQAYIEEGLRRHRSAAYPAGTIDCSEADVAAAARPVKAFLTRMAKERNRFGNPLASAADREYILRSVTE